MNKPEYPEFSVGEIFEFSHRNYPPTLMKAVQIIAADYWCDTLFDYQLTTIDGLICQCHE